MKKAISVAVIFVLFFSYNAMASVNKPLKNLGKALDNIVYADLEVPDNANETGSKGTVAFPDCTDKTKDDVGRGIARFVGGVYQLVTFWYPKEES